MHPPGKTTVVGFDRCIQTRFRVLVPKSYLKVVAKGRITLSVVILAKAGIHFSPHILDFNGVEKSLNPRLFPSFLRKRESTARWIPAFARMTAGGGFDFCDTREGGDDERAMSRGLKPFAPSSFTGSKISGSLKYPILIDPKTKNFFSRRLSKVSWN